MAVTYTFLQIIRCTPALQSGSVFSVCRNLAAHPAAPQLARPLVIHHTCTLPTGAVVYAAQPNAYLQLTGLTNHPAPCAMRYSISVHTLPYSGFIILTLLILCAYHAADHPAPCALHYSTSVHTILYSGFITETLLNLCRRSPSTMCYAWLTSVHAMLNLEFIA